MANARALVGGAKQKCVRPAMSQILIVDPSCVDGSGHHFRSLIDLCTALAPREAHLLLNEATPRDLFPPQTDVIYGLKATVYDDTQLGSRPDDRVARRIWKLKRLVADTRRSLAGLVTGGDKQDERKWPELWAVLGQLTTPPDHIVVPSADVALICELLPLLAAKPELAHTQLHARLISVERNLPRLAQAKAKFDANAALSRLHLYVEMPAMARHLTSQVGLESALFPYLLAPPIEAYAKRADPTGLLVFGFLGGARNEKGFYRLPAILRAMSSAPGYDRARCSFLIQSSGRTAQAQQAIGQVIKTINAMDVTATFIDGVVDEATYARLMAQIDVLLLPYQGQRYKLSGSGILNEAIVSAKPVIATAGLSFGDYLRAGNGIEASCDVSFAAGIVAMTLDPSGYLARAAEQARAYQANLANQPLLSRLCQTILP